MGGGVRRCLFGAVMPPEHDMNFADEIMAEFRKLSNSVMLLANDMSHIRDATSATKSQTEQLVRNDAQQETLIRASHKRMDKIEPIVSEVAVMTARVNQMEPKVNEHEAIKNKGLGILTFASFAFGLLGALVSKFLFGGSAH